MIVKEFKAPVQGALSHINLFLAGSIEMGAAIDWQEDISKFLKDLQDVPITTGKQLSIFNPRRDDWDSSWDQRESNPQFNEQVNWELHYLEESDIIFMYFANGTKSPISLLELGLFKDKDIIVYCDKFWRRGNVEIVCSRYGIPLYDDIEKAKGALKTKIISKISK